MPPLHPSLSLKSSDKSGLWYLSFQRLNLSCLFFHLCPPGVVNGCRASGSRLSLCCVRSGEKLPSFVRSEIHYFQTCSLLPHALTHCLRGTSPTPPLSSWSHFLFQYEDLLPSWLFSVSIHLSAVASRDC